VLGKPDEPAGLDVDEPVIRGNHGRTRSGNRAQKPLEVPIERRDVLPDGRCGDAVDGDGLASAASNATGILVSPLFCAMYSVRSTLMLHHRRLECVRFPRLLSVS
jgi:hypothetical protein